MSNMVVATNVLALNSHRNMKIVGSTQAKTSARLSSGYRINSAADDAAGLAISEKMRSQIRGLDQASRNAQDGISLIQTAEGGMQEIDNMVQRIRELIVQASNDTNDQTDANKAQGDRQKIQDEIDQLTQEIDSMAERVEFNKKKVISGEYAGGDTAQRSTLKTNATALVNTKEAIMKDWDENFGVELAKDAATTATVSSELLNDAKKAYAQLLGATTEAEVTAAVAAMTAAAAAITTSAASFDKAAAYIEKVATDANLGAKLQTDAAALDTAKKTLKDGVAGLYFQVGANAFQGINSSINSVKTNSLGIGDGAGKSKIDVTKASGETITGQIAMLDSALTYVTTERSKMGAVQNRLEYTIKSLDISSENLSAAESRVRDADMGKEMMTLTKANVLQQAAISMLAQGNQAPQAVLQLLG